jgi:immune inhibitor A
MRIVSRSYLYICFVVVVVCGSSGANGAVPALTTQGVQWLEEVKAHQYHHANNARSISERSLPDSTPLLTLLVSFADRAVTTSDTEWQQRLFDGDKSLSTYFDWVSQDHYRLTNAGIVAIDLPVLHPDSGTDFKAGGRLAEMVLNRLTEQFDITRFDHNGDGEVQSTELAIMMVIAGYEQAYGGADAWHPNVWAHQSRVKVYQGRTAFGRYIMVGEKHGHKMASIGIVAHELGHLLFDLPDLYDPDGSSQGIGKWGLMGRGIWNQHYGQAGDSPAAMMAWSREQAGLARSKGWVDGEPLDLSAGEFVKIRTSGSETFYVERRIQQGFDISLPGSGLLISHVDQAINSNSNESHKLLDIEEADGLNQLDQGMNAGDAGDTFPGIYQVGSFDARSAPSSTDYRGGDTGLEVQIVSDSQLIIDLEARSISSSASGSASVWLMIWCLPLWGLRRRTLALL